MRYVSLFAGGSGNLVGNCVANVVSVVCVGGVGGVEGSVEGRKREGGEGK